MVNLTLLATLSLLAASSSVQAAGGHGHQARSGRPHAGRSVAPRRLDRRVVKSSSCTSSSTSSSSSAHASQSSTHISLSVSASASHTSVASSARATSSSSHKSPASSVVSKASSAVQSASKTASSSAAAATSTAATSSSTNKLVAVHFMVGNSYSYTPSMWAADIKQAAASGFDAFALNLGTDSWQASQIASAFAAAKAYGTSFKLFLSFDMTVYPCSSSGDAAAILALAEEYADHPNHATYESTGRPIVSTFAGSDCTFGQGDWITGWQNAVKTPYNAATSKEMFFVPSVFADPSTFAGAGVMDGELNWNGGWPSTDSASTWSTDDTYISALGDKAYMAAVSPLFYTHYGPQTYNKNWLFLSDNFMFASRWKSLVDNRDKVDMVEALTWNDFGESSYLGPIQGDQPNSQGWVDGFDHTALLAINQYYATAYKTGSYPAITKDVIYLSARPHARTATATSDSVGRPTGGQNGPSDGYLWPADEFFALVFASAAGEVTLSSGSNSKTVAVEQGVNWLSCELEVGKGMSAVFNDVSLTPDFTFVDNPSIYNWNYYFFSSS